MADKKKSDKIEREYIINLRREFIKKPRYKRAKKSVTAVKEFLIKHMKSEDIVIGKYLNQEIWKNGPKNPPAKIHIKVIKEDNKVKAELINAPEEKPKEETKKRKLFKKSTKEEKTEKPKQVDMSLMQKQEKVMKEEKKEKKQEKVPKNVDLKEQKDKK